MLPLYTTYGSISSKVLWPSLITGTEKFFTHRKWRKVKKLKKSTSSEEKWRNQVFWTDISTEIWTKSANLTNVQLSLTITGVCLSPLLLFRLDWSPVDSIWSFYFNPRPDHRKTMTNRQNGYFTRVILWSRKGSNYTVSNRWLLVHNAVKCLWNLRGPLD